MNKDFSRIITLLRKEKKLSQKQVAADLDISQALLSHYEKGIRECGLEFLSKIADYYNVSCDYLLGRTPQRYSDAYESNEDNNKQSRQSVSQVVNKKLIQNTQNVIFDCLNTIGNRKLTNNVSNYLMLATYNMFRKLYSANDDNPLDMFAVHKEVYGGFANAAMEILNTRIGSATDEKCETDFVKSSKDVVLSPDILASKYPESASYVFNLVQHAESNMKFKK